MAHGIYRWVFQIPLSDVDTSQGKSNQGNNPCLLCGKEVTKTEWMVHLLTDGNLVSSDQDFDNSQGLFPVGPECRGRLPNNFTFKSE